MLKVEIKWSICIFHISKQILQYSDFCSWAQTSDVSFQQFKVNVTTTFVLPSTSKWTNESMDYRVFPKDSNSASFCVPFFSARKCEDIVL